MDRRGRGAPAGRRPPMRLPPPRRSAGARAWRSGARTARASSGCAAPPTSRSTRPAAGRACRSRSSARLPRRRRPRAATASRWRSAPASTATSVLSLAGLDAAAAQPRAHARHEPFRRGVGRGPRPRPRVAHPAGPVAALPEGRRRRSRGVLSRRRTGSSWRCS